MKKHNWVAQDVYGTIGASVNKPRVVEQLCSWAYGVTDEFERLSHRSKQERLPK